MLFVRPTITSFLYCKTLFVSDVATLQVLKIRNMAALKKIMIPFLSNCPAKFWILMVGNCPIFDHHFTISGSCDKSDIEGL